MSTTGIFSIRPGRKFRTAFRQKDFVTTRYSLLSRLENREDQASWNDFFETYWRLIYALAIRAGLTETEAEDVVQETVICVAKDIHKFQRDRSLGSFKGWLRNLTRWRIADQLRKRGPSGRRFGAREDEIDAPALEDIPDPAAAAVELHWEEEWQANLVESALERVRRRIRDEHYQIFDLYVVKQWPVGKVARRLGVSLSQIYVTKHRISALIKKEIQLMENQVHDVGATGSG